MSKKANKPRAVIEWPDSHFTIHDVQDKYPKVINITLRFRVKRAEEMGVIVCIGNVKPPIGRPRKVYAKKNPSQSLLDEAAKSGVILDGTVKSVKVAEVKVEPPSTTTTPSVTA